MTLASKHVFHRCFPFGKYGNKACVTILQVTYGVNSLRSRGCGGYGDDWSVTIRSRNLKNPGGSRREKNGNLLSVDREGCGPASCATRIPATIRISEDRLLCFRHKRSPAEVGRGTRPCCYHVHAERRDDPRGPIKMDPFSKPSCQGRGSASRPNHHQNKRARDLRDWPRVAERPQQIYKRGTIG